MDNVMLLTVVCAAMVGLYQGQVRAQEMVVCFNEVDCLGDFLGITTPRDCCVQNVFGRSFAELGEEVCVECVVLGFFQDSFIGVEQESAYTVQVGFQKGGGREFSLPVFATDGTAREGFNLDYTVNTTNVVFQVGSPPDNVVFFLNVDDIALESNETFSLELNATTVIIREGIFVRDTLNMTIVDSDTPEISLTPQTINIFENASVVEVCITVEGFLARSVVVTADTAPKTGASNQATAGSDYLTTQIIVDFEPRAESTQTRCGTVEIIDDTVANEPDEQFVVRLASANPAGNLGNETCITIIDDDLVTVGFGSGSVTVNEISREFRMCVEKTVVTVQDVTVTIRADDVTATSDLDYLPSGIPVTVTIPASDLTACFTGPIIDDLLALEPQESFTLTITSISPDNARIRPGIEVTEIFIVDNDSRYEMTTVNVVDEDHVTVGFGSGSVTVNEISGEFRMCVEKTVVTVQDVTVTIRADDVTATSDLDYLPSGIPVTVTIPASDLTACFIGPIIDDLLALEPQESFTLTITSISPDNARIRPGIEVTEIFIVDNDTTESYDVNLEIVGSPTNVVVGRYEMTTVNVVDEDLVTVGFGSGSVTVNESSGEFRMCVEKTVVTVQDITVTIRADDVTATSDLDYLPSGIPVTVTIPASDLTACFTGPIIDDLLALEPQESFTLTITSISPDNARIQPGIEVTEIFIIDNDIVRVRFQEPKYLFREESGLATVCLVKDLETVTNVVVETVTSDNTASDGSDYVGGSVSVTFGTSADQQQCREIPLIVDNEREDREDFFVDLNIGDTGSVRRGDPSRTVVAIEESVPVCHENAVLENSGGMLVCVCIPGFTGDGVTFCDDIDECCEMTDDCSENAKCVNTEGSFECVCKPGYTGDGRNCEDIDECTTDENICDDFVTCSNLQGGYKCMCTQDDGTNCITRDVTTGTPISSSRRRRPINSRSTSQSSKNFWCCEGYTLDRNGQMCIDVNECVTGGNDCNLYIKCVNLPGTFKCVCNCCNTPYKKRRHPKITYNMKGTKSRKKRSLMRK